MGVQRRPDGRLVLDQLSAPAPGLLTDGGTVLFVQSEFAGIRQSVNALRSVGLSADVVARQRIPFGPVLTARARWLEAAEAECQLSVLKLRGGGRLPYLHVCRILIKMADTFFSTSWRIREPHSGAALCA